MAKWVGTKTQVDGGAEGRRNGLTTSQPDTSRQQGEPRQHEMIDRAARRSVRHEVIVTSASLGGGRGHHGRGRGGDGRGGSRGRSRCCWSEEVVSRSSV